eukprot:4966380-Pyramimonas_sp.AAC.1
MLGKETIFEKEGLIGSTPGNARVYSFDIFKGGVNVSGLMFVSVRVYQRYHVDRRGFMTFSRSKASKQLSANMNGGLCGSQASR